jgi:hypothetical protein
MRAAILGSAVVALLAGEVFAQNMLDVPSGAAPSTTTKSQYTPPPPRASNPNAAPGATTSKITFHSRPPGARITLSDGKSCIAPCSFTVGFNEKFTAVASKPGYRAKEIDVSPSVTDRGKAQIIGSALGAGVIGLVVGAAMADRAYGTEPFVVELVADPTAPVVAYRPVKPEGAATKPATVAPKSAAIAPKAQGTDSKPAAIGLKPAGEVSKSKSEPAAERPVTATPAAAAPKPVAAAQKPRPAVATAPAQAQISCSAQGCVTIKAGCRVMEHGNVSSSSGIGGGTSAVTCR